MCLSTMDHVGVVGVSVTMHVVGVVGVFARRCLCPLWTWSVGLSIMDHVGVVDVFVQ